MYRSIFNPVNTWAENIKRGKKTVECLCVCTLATASSAKLAVTLKNAPRQSSVCPLSEGPAEQNQPYWAWCFAQGFLLTEWSQVAAQSDLCTAWWLIRCVKDRPRLLLLLVCLMRCHCPAGWAGPDRRRGRSTVPKLSLCDFAWLMDCDWTQLQGCLCRVFAFFFSPWGESVWSEKKCETLLNWADGSQLSYQQARLHSWCTLQRAPEGSPLSAGKRFSLYIQLLQFQYKKESDFSFITYMSLYSMRAEKPTVGWF